jgi:hypothetical protein
VPDGVSGNTRCPKCGTVFPVVKPAFEVVEGAPAPKPAPRTAPKPAPAPKSVITPKLPPEPAAFEVVGDDEPKSKRPRDDEDEERPKKKRRDDDDEDDSEDRPRKKQRDEDEDEDDRPRARKNRRDDDDDDDRSKKKSKKKRYFDEYEDDWQPRRGGGGGEMAKGRTAALLLSVSFWMNLGAYGLLALYLLIAMAVFNGSSPSSPSSSRGGRSSASSADDGSLVELFVILPGLIGLGAWIVGTVGCSFAIAGPRKARGMAITATVFAGLHLILIAITFGNMQEGSGASVRSVPGAGKAAWIIVASALPILDAFLPFLFYASRALNGEFVIALLAGGCECARLIFALFALKALALAARDYDASEKAGFGVMIVSGIMLGVALVVLLVVILLAEGGFKNFNTIFNLGFATLFLMYLAYALMMLVPASAALATKAACERRG